MAAQPLPPIIPETITPDALEFAETHGLTHLLPRISDAIKRYIPGLEAISVVREVDPEIEDYVLLFFEMKTQASFEELWEGEGKVSDVMCEILTPEQFGLVGIIPRF